MARETRARLSGKLPVIFMGARISELTPSIFAVHRHPRGTRLAPRWLMARFDV